ncbi:MAG TPA: hypothetical protein VGM00_16630 [Bradyrhizobium sp.]
MSEKFDPYGEVSPATVLENRKAARMESASVALDRAGQFAFWLLVVVIVSARIIWYPVVPSFESGSASEPKQLVMR